MDGTLSADLLPTPCHFPSLGFTAFLSSEIERQRCESERTFHCFSELASVSLPQRMKHEFWVVLDREANHALVGVEVSCPMPR